MSHTTRQCHCQKCVGKIVNIKTYLLHAANASKKLHETTIQEQKLPDICFPEVQRQQAAYTKPLHEGSNRTILDAISDHLFIFSTNNGMSKTALSQCLQHEKKTLPQPNNLPSTYQEAVTIIKPLLIPIQKFKCCINDCKIFIINDKTSTCPACDQSLLTSRNRCKKTFHYMPFVPRIARWFGTKNLAKILHANKLRPNGPLRCSTDGEIFQQHLKTGVFADTQTEYSIPLALFTDGVNPNRNQNVQKSFWPLIVTWISLPQELRYLLGPMMLAGIVPGCGRKEPKSLDPYIDELVTELLENLECRLYDSYTEAPVTVKLALLQYLCDIPAFSKLLHCSGQAALRSCFFCKDVGVYSHSLSKVIHINNRDFLPITSTLRQDTQSFAKKSTIEAVRPSSYTKEEEMQLRRQYDQKPNNNQRMKLQKETGFKGTHPFHKLPYFDRVQQMQPDGMHTIADVITNIVDFVSGKTDGPKVRHAERDFNRFEDTWTSILAKGMKRKAASQNSKSVKQSRSDQNNRDQTTPSLPETATSDETQLPTAPWVLSKDGKKIADQRAQMIRYTRGFDYTPADHFSRPWTLRTMHGKQQFVTQNVAAWCLRGLLGKQQEETLFNLFKVIDKLVQPSYLPEELPQLKADTSTAVSLLERDFPLTLQNITTHLLHHIPEGYDQFGPLYDRWLYPLERANSWITRQILQHGHEESTVMQTYSIYDWSSFNILSGEQETYGNNNSLCRLAEKIKCDNTSPAIPETSFNSREIMLTKQETLDLQQSYKDLGIDIQLYEIDPIASCLKSFTRFDSYLQKNVFFSCSDNQHSSSRSCDSMVMINAPNPRFGKIIDILRHNRNGTFHVFVKLELYPVAEKIDQFWCSDNCSVQTQLFSFNEVSNPLVTAIDNDMLWFINV